MTPKFIIACEKGLIDDGNKISAIGIFTKLPLGPSNSSIRVNFDVVGLFDVVEGAENPSVAKMEVIGPDGSLVGDPIELGNTKPAPGSLNVVVNLPLFEFTYPGLYSIRLSHGGDELYKGEFLEVLSNSVPTE